MNRLVFSVLLAIGLALAVVAVYCAVVVMNEPEGRWVMCGAAALGLFVAGFSVFALRDEEPPIERQGADLNTLPIDSPRIELRLMRWPGWAWLLTVIALAILAEGYLILGLDAEVPEDRAGLRQIAVPLGVFFGGLWWVGRQAMQAFGVRLFKTPAENQTRTDADEQVTGSATLR